MEIKSQDNVLLEAICFDIILTVVFIILKLIQIIDWNWFYVFSPILCFKTLTYLLWSLIDLMIFCIKIRIKRHKRK